MLLLCCCLSSSIVFTLGGKPQSRVFRKSGDLGTVQVPANGGVTVAKQEWTDGIPQQLVFTMKLPAGWNDGDDGTRFDRFARNQWVSAGAKERRSFKYHAWLGKGDTACSIAHPTYESLAALAQQHEVECLGPGDCSAQSWKREFVGYGGRPSFAATQRGIKDEHALQLRLSYQESCVFVSCQMDMSRTRVSKELGGRMFCPIEVSAHWRPQHYLQTSAATLIPESQVSDHVKMLSMGFHIAVFVNILLCGCVSMASVKVCFMLSDKD